MNKQFARKFVNWKVEKMDDEIKGLLTMGDLIAVANDVADDALDLSYVGDELRFLADCNRTIKDEAQRIQDGREALTDICSGDY